MVKSGVKANLHVEKLPAFCVALPAFGVVAAKTDARPLWNKSRSDNLSVLFPKASIL
jgi:hypothetical protein